MVGGERRPSQVLDSYLLRSLAVAGYAPSFDALRPLRPRGAAPLVQPVVRRDALHRPAGCPARPARPPETVALLGALLAGDWPVVEAADPRHLKEASGLVAAYLAWHLERGLRSHGARRALTQLDPFRWSRWRGASATSLETR